MQVAVSSRNCRCVDAAMAQGSCTDRTWDQTWASSAVVVLGGGAKGRVSDARIGDVAIAFEH